jgi:PadR family transcriptional regulator, regulatory protein PadR
MPIPILQGTLDLMILRTLATMGPQHAYGIANRLLQVSEDSLNLNQGTIYPALVRIEQRGWTRAPGARRKTVAKRSITPSLGRD